MGFLPRDFLETREGLVFAVVDPHLEREHVLAFLRYAPVAGALAKLDTQGANAYLQTHFPHYLFQSERLEASLHGVPVGAIGRHHRPRERVRHLLLQESHDALESKLLRLLRLLIEAGVRADCLGVTGSLLIGRQNHGSDLDLVVYDRLEFHKARATVRRTQSEGILDELDAAGWDDAYRRRGCDLDFDDFVRHERRKANKGALDGTKFDLALVEEALEADNSRWQKTGPAIIEAVVTDASGAFGQPARYRLDHPEIMEVLSFTHTYVGQAVGGERVQAAGIVEVSESGAKRLIIGSSREAPGEYLRVLWQD